MKTTLNLNDEVLRQAKLRAQVTGTTLTAFVEAALRSQLMPDQGSARKYKFDPPVALGTRPPALDVSDREELYEFFDRA